MHTTSVMKSKDFTYIANGKKASFSDIFPNFHAQEQVGIVVRHPGSRLGASALLMAAVTNFHDFYRPN